MRRFRLRLDLIKSYPDDFKPFEFETNDELPKWLELWFEQIPESISITTNGKRGYCPFPISCNYYKTCTRVGCRADVLSNGEPIKWS